MAVHNTIEMKIMKTLFFSFELFCGYVARGRDGSILENFLGEVSTGLECEEELKPSHRKLRLEES